MPTHIVQNEKPIFESVNNNITIDARVRDDFITNFNDQLIMPPASDLNSTC